MYPFWEAWETHILFWNTVALFAYGDSANRGISCILVPTKRSKFRPPAVICAQRAAALLCGIDLLCLSFSCLVVHSYLLVTLVAHAWRILCSYVRTCSDPLAQVYRGAAFYVTCGIMRRSAEFWDVISLFEGAVVMVFCRCLWFIPDVDVSRCLRDVWSKMVVYASSGIIGGPKNSVNLQLDEVMRWKVMNNSADFKKLVCVVALSCVMRGHQFYMLVTALLSCFYLVVVCCGEKLVCAIALLAICHLWFSKCDWFLSRHNTILTALKKTSDIPYIN